jgi:hypothetical protein
VRPFHLGSPSPEAATCGESYQLEVESGLNHTRQTQVKDLSPSRLRHPGRGAYGALRAGVAGVYKVTLNRVFALSDGKRQTVSRWTTVVGKERCESGRIGLTANELTW